MLKHGAKADVKDAEGANALIIFGESSNGQHPAMDVRIVKALLKAGAVPNIKDNAGRIPLLSWMNTSPHCVEPLIKGGADAKAMVGGHRTLLHQAAGSYRQPAVSVRAVIVAGVAVDAVESDGNTALMTAGQIQGRWQNWGAMKRSEGEVELIALLLDAGANVNARNKSGETPLMAWVEKTPESVAYLLKRGADLNARSHYGNTALALAALWAPLDNVKLLVEAGAELNSVNEDGGTPLDRAGRNKNSQIAEYLKSLGAKTGAELKADEK